MIFEARSSSRRWTRVTVRANLVRKMASSMAESPPPTTAMSWSRKKKPSQVAQVDRPWPSSAASSVEAEHQRLGAGGDDDRLGLVGGLGGVGVADPDPERAGRQVDPGHLLGADLGAEARGLLAEAHHQLGAHDPLGEAGEVLDLGGEHQLAAGLVAGGRRLALDDQRGEVGPGGVDGGGEAGGAGPMMMTLRTSDVSDMNAPDRGDIPLRGMSVNGSGSASIPGGRGGLVPLAEDKCSCDDHDQAEHEVGEPDPGGQAPGRGVGWRR